MFRVEQIDHVELFVPDRYEAARWYKEILGLAVLPEHEDWASHPSGPLMISSDGGSTKLALFEGEPQGTRPTVGHRRVAFRVDGRGFNEFLGRLQDHPLFDEEGRRLGAVDVVDHGKAFSIYFCDPWGNRYEVTTYDYQVVSEKVKTKSAR